MPNSPENARHRNGPVTGAGPEGLELTDIQFRSLIENSLDISVILGLDGIIRYVSPAVVRSLGYQPDELTGQSAFAFINEADKQGVAEALTRIASDPKTSPAGNLHSFRFKHKNGAWRFLEAISGRLPGESDAVGIMVTARDVTERMVAQEALDLAEEDLRQSEQRTRSIVENAYDAFIAMDESGLITDWNPQAERTFGWTSQEAIGLVLADLVVPPNLRERHRQGLEQYLATGQGPVLGQRLELPALHRDGHEFPVELTISAIDVGGSHTFTAILHDITEQKRTEEALRESEERYRTLVGNLSEGVFQMTLDGKYVSANSALAHMLGYDSPDDLMTTVGSRQRLHVDPELAKIYSDQLTENGFVENFEAPIYQKSGSIIWVSTNSKVIVNDDGTTSHYAGTVVDITARMAAEQAKETALLELEKSEDQARQLANEAQLLSSTLQVAATLESFEEALQRCIDIVCEYIGWPVGHLYIPDPRGSGELQPTSIWHLDDPRAFEQFRSVTEQTRFLPGVGLPGRILSSGEPAWITDVQNDDNFPRNKAGGDIKVRGAFGFPVNVGAETVAVLEFFDVEPRQPDTSILDLMRLVGYQIGQVLERERSRGTLAQQSEAFFNISSILSEPDSYEKKLDFVMEELARVAEADGANLRVPDPQENGLRLVSRVGDLELSSFEPEASALSKAALESGQPVVVNDYPAHPDAHPQFISKGAKSVVSMPIKGAGETVAVAVVISKAVDHFDPERVRLLTAIVDGLGPLLENAKLDEQIREELERRRETEAQLLQRSTELEALFKISGTLAEPGAYDDKLQGVLEDLILIAQADWATLRITDPQVGGLRLVARVGDNPKFASAGHRDSGLGLAAMETGQILVENDYQSNSDAYPSAVAAGAKSMIMLPIKAAGESIAVAAVVSKEANHFNPDLVRLLTAISDGLGVLLEHAQLEGQIGEELERRRVTEVQLLHRTEELEALFKISSIVSEPGAFEDKLRGVMQELARVAEADWATVLASESQEGVLRSVVRVGMDGSALPAADSVQGTSVAAFVSGQVELANDYLSQPNLDPSAAASGAKSVISFPIKGAEDTLAVVSVVSKEKDHFDPDRVRLLTTIVEGLGPLLENAKLDGQIREELDRRRQTEAELLQRSKELEALFSISNILGQQGPYQDNLNQVMEVVLRVSEATWGNLRTPDPQEGGLRIVASAGMDADAISMVQGGGAGIADNVFESREPVVVNDYANNPDARQSLVALGVSSVIGLPITVTGKALGVVVVVSEEPDYFNPERVRLLTAIVDGLGPILENARLDGQVREELELRRQTEAQLLQRSEELGALFKISSILAEPGDYDGKLNSVLKELLLIADGHWVNLLVPQPQERGMTVIAHARSDGSSIPVVASSRGLAVDVWESGELLVENDYTSNPNADAIAIREGARSMLGLPIMTSAETSAVVAIMSDDLDHFDPERVRLLTAIVEGLGPLLENARLNEEIAAKEEALRQSQKLESVGQLAAGVAHEVNNPLSSILGFSRLLLGQEIPDQAKQDVQIIFDEAQRGTTIIQDLLSFARKGTSEKKIIDISGGLNRVLNLKAADFRANRVKVNTEIEDGLPKVEADEQQLQQVYLNLLTNAQHAMFDANDGGNIEIHCKRAGNVLRLSFVDDGPGMTMETLEKIFEPFYTTKADGKGTGLGLSVCYGIIADHGGRLWAESEPGSGATFFIELPYLLGAESGI